MSQLTDLELLDAFFSEEDRLNAFRLDVERLLFAEPV